MAMQTMPLFRQMSQHHRIQDPLHGSCLTLMSEITQPSHDNGAEYDRNKKKKMIKLSGSILELPSVKGDFFSLQQANPPLVW